MTNGKHEFFQKNSPEQLWEKGLLIDWVQAPNEHTLFLMKSIEDIDNFQKEISTIAKNFSGEDLDKLCEQLNEVVEKYVVSDKKELINGDKLFAFLLFVRKDMEGHRPDWLNVENESYLEATKNVLLLTLMLERFMHSNVLVRGTLEQVMDDNGERIRKVFDKFSDAQKELLPKEVFEIISDKPLDDSNLLPRT